MFIKRGDGVITGVIETPEKELSDDQKKKAEKLAKEMSDKKELIKSN